MKVLLTLAISGAALLAQTPPPATKAAPKTGAPAAASKTGTATKTGATKTGAAKSAAPSAALMNPALARATAPELYRVKFTTTKGDFVVEVNRSWAPLGADRFYNLVRIGYFKDASFFRVISNFIVQFGMHADPKVNAIWEKANIKADDPVKQGNKRGTIVFATAGPKTRTTQLFINLKDNSASLDGMGFAAFGTVTEGMTEVVDKIYSGYGEGSDSGGRGPTQARLGKEGKPYLDKNFPQLDSIKSATIIFPEGPPPPPAKKAAPATKTGAPAAPATKAPATKKAAEPAKK